MHDGLMRLAEARGIMPRYTDVTGVVRETSHETALALLDALGEPVDNLTEAADRARAIEAKDSAGVLPDWQVVGWGQDAVEEGISDEDWSLELEDGPQLEGHGITDFPALPLGIHRLWINGRKTVLLAAPERLPLPDPCWGLMVPLWGLRGRVRGGTGDFGDLEELATALGSGPGFLGINPVHAGFPTVDSAFSPYQPSHRRRLNILHIPFAGAASNGALIDYPAEFAARRKALEQEFAAFDHDPWFDAFCAEEGAPLQLFARHQALSERFGPYWTDWPARYRDPEASGDADPARVRFHCWAQWRAELALGAAHKAARDGGMAHGLYLDLAVGTHPAGAETWEDAESFVRGASLGAPPDALGPEGQVWNLAPFHPDALIAKDFQPLAETLRRQFRHCGILRIDHILGFDRAFWVPQNGAPGGYIRMPRDAMLAVARIEAARAGGVVVGEDLGVVPDGLREALDRSGILGCRVAMFERDGDTFRSPDTYPEAAIASFSTHDLPTWDGWRSGRDLSDWAALGAIAPEALTRAQAARDEDVAAFDAAMGSPPAPDGTALHRFLATSKARLVAVQAETLLAMPEQPNMPGTVDDYPNWRHRLTGPATALGNTRAYGETLAVMAQENRMTAATD